MVPPFAETRAEFHRHAKRIDDGLKAIVRKASALTVEQRVQARMQLIFLQGETRNLLMCARITRFDNMVARLEMADKGIREAYDNNEAALQAECAVNERRFSTLDAAIASGVRSVLGKKPFDIAVYCSAIIIDGKGTPVRYADLLVHDRGTIPFESYQLWCMPAGRAGWSLASGLAAPPNGASAWRGPYRTESVAAKVRTLMLSDFAEAREPAYA